METVAITGATGLLGANVATAFAAAGWRVRAVQRVGSRVDHLGHLPIDWRAVSFDSPQELIAAIAGADAVVHCAGVTAQSARLGPTHRAGNIELTRIVLKACAAAGIRRMVHCSSTVTCGFSTVSSPPVTEDSAEMPVPPWPDAYAASKRAAENLALQHFDSMEVVVVNPGFLVGPLDSKPSSGRLMLHAAHGHAWVWTSGCNNFVDVRDVAVGIVRAVYHGRPGERYILGGHNLTYRDFIGRVARIAGRAPPPFRMQNAIARAAGIAGDLVEWTTTRSTDVNSVTMRYAGWDGMRYSSAKAARELAYTARPIEEAITAALSWFERTGALPGTVRPSGAP